MAYVIIHSGVKNQKWGVRHWQNPDGSLKDPQGYTHYGLIPPSRRGKDSIKTNTKNMSKAAKKLKKSQTDEEREVYRKQIDDYQKAIDEEYSYVTEKTNVKNTQNAALNTANEYLLKPENISAGEKAAIKAIQKQNNQNNQNQQRNKQTAQITPDQIVNGINGVIDATSRASENKLQSAISSLKSKKDSAQNKVLSDSEYAKAYEEYAKRDQKAFETRQDKENAKSAWDTASEKTKKAYDAYTREVENGIFNGSKYQEYTQAKKNESEAKDAYARLANKSANDDNVTTMYRNVTERSDAAAASAKLYSNTISEVSSRSNQIRNGAQTAKDVLGVIGSVYTLSKTLNGQK